MGLAVAVTTTWLPEQHTPGAGEGPPMNDLPVCDQEVVISWLSENFSDVSGLVMVSYGCSAVYTSICAQEYLPNELHSIGGKRLSG